MNRSVANSNQQLAVNYNTVFFLYDIVYVSIKAVMNEHKNLCILVDHNKHMLLNLHSCSHVFVFVVNFAPCFVVKLLIARVNM